MSEQIIHAPGWAPEIQMTKRPLVGPLRAPNNILTDDSGPRRVFFASYFSALRVLRDRSAEFAREFDSIARASFHGARQFIWVGGYHGFWGGYEMSPVAYTQDDGTRIEATPDYDDLIIEMCSQATRRGLRLALTTGDIQYIVPDPNVELAQHQRVAQLVAEHGGADVVASWEIRNEWYVNSPRVSDDANWAQMRRCAAAVRAILPNVLVSTSNINASQDPAEFVQAMQGADLVHIHGMRSPGDRAIDRAMHGVAWGEGLNQYRPYGVWQMEPASAVCDHGGCTDPILSKPYLTALYAMHAVTGQGSTFFQGNAVTPTATPLADVWGFKELPALFEELIPDDVATWEHGYAHQGSILWWWNASTAITVVAEGWDFTTAVPFRSATVIIGDQRFDNVTDLSSVLTPGFQAALIVGQR